MCDEIRNRFLSAADFRGVSLPRPAVDITRVPSDFDALIDWFELVSYALVLLEEFRLPEIRSAVGAIERAVLAHVRASPLGTLLSPTGESPLSALERVVDADHVWFRTSLEQLRWFLSVVERDDHGGNRQALGQYGRLLAESLRRHRLDERELLRVQGTETGSVSTHVPPRNSN